MKAAPKTAALLKPKTSVADDLKRVAQMAELFRNAAAAVADAQGMLDDAKAEFDKVRLEDFPLLMDEVGMTKVTLEDGTTIEIKPDIDCAVTETNRPLAHAWLRKNEFGGLIKSQLIVSFGKDQDKLRGQVLRMVSQKTDDIEAREAVHPATLKSFIKEQREKGKSPPEDLFGIHPFKKAVLKEPK